MGFRQQPLYFLLFLYDIYATMMPPSDTLAAAYYCAYSHMHTYLLPQM